jgi:hypothetical protein
MCGAIDTRLGAISSGTVHSCVGGCDPRGLFAKRVLYDDWHHALAITSLRSLIQENMVYKCATRFHFRIPKNLSRREQLLMPSRGFVYVLDKRKRRADSEGLPIACCETCGR